MASLTVLGIGNLLMQDDGVGVRVMEGVRDARDWPEAVEFIDGGAGGMNLLNLLEEAERLIVFDSAEMKLAPGEYRVVTPNQLCDPPAEHRATLHDVPFLETLTLVGRFLHRPEEVRLLAIQPKAVDYGRELTGALKAAMPAVVRAGVDLVADICRAHNIS